MKLAYLNCFSGVSGDMLLGAWVGCGLDLAAIEREVGRLHLDGTRWEQQQVKRGSIMATRVIITGPENPPHRHYQNIVELIRTAGLPKRVEERALAIFRRLGEAEAKLHGWPLEKVHFHEVGAVDSISDIVGSCVAMELLGIEELHSSPLNLGSGTITCDHGVLPVPAPATAELLKGVPVYSSGLESELVTPTGAAIVSTLAKNFGPLPVMRIENVGYGAGARDHSGFPNVLRVMIGETVAPEAGLEPLLILEANIDDMNPQICGFFAERAFAVGALDVFFAPVQMKKNRPGLLLSVLCRPESRESLMQVFFQETTTLGVRSHEVFRRALDREFVSVSTRYGQVQIKVARQDGRVLNFSPEYEDCRQLAEKNGVPLRRIFEEAAAIFRNQFGSGT